TIGQCRRSTAASRKTPPPAVPVPGLAGYQMTVASGRGWPVVLDVRVQVMVVSPTVNGPGAVTSAWARVGASSARAVSQCGVRIPVSRCTTLFRSVQRPLSPDALEAMDAALHEAQARSRDQILHRAGDQHLVRVRLRSHARADVHGDAAHVGARVAAQANADEALVSGTRSEEHTSELQSRVHLVC